MAWSESAMHESFGFVNISPQKPTFNRGIWRKLEEQVRLWTKANDTLWVVTGPLIDRRVDTIMLRNRVAVPGRFYKALLRHHRQQWQAIAFLMPNSGSKAKLWEYSMAIDELEAATGIDFFPALPDSIECRVEGKCELKEWFKQHNK
jgi:endonuclease G